MAHHAQACPHLFVSKSRVAERTAVGVRNREEALQEFPWVRPPADGEEVDDLDEQAGTQLRCRSVTGPMRNGEKSRERLASSCEGIRPRLAE
jgi:hypothetical protein